MFLVKFTDGSIAEVYCDDCRITEFGVAIFIKGDFKGDIVVLATPIVNIYSIETVEYDGDEYSAVSYL